MVVLVVGDLERVEQRVDYGSVLGGARRGGGGDDTNYSGVVGN